MERRDIIKDEIERLGQVLGTILLKLLGKNLNYEESHEYTRAQFSEKLDLDFDQLSQLPAQELLDFLKGKGFTLHHLDQIAQVFQALAEKANAKDLYLKALAILNHVHTADPTYSLERQSRLDGLGELINSDH